MYLYFDKLKILSHELKSFSLNNATRVAWHQTLKGHPKAEFIATEASELNISLSLHQRTSKIYQMLEGLNAFLSSGKSFCVVWASGVYQGKFILEKINQVFKATDAKGLIIAIDLDLSLKSSTEQKKDNKKPDPALFKFNSNFTEQKPTRANALNSLIKVNNQAKEILTMLDKPSQITAEIESFKTLLKTDLTDAKRLINEPVLALKLSRQIINNLDNLKNNLDDKTKLLQALKELSANIVTTKGQIISRR